MFGVFLPVGLLQEHLDSPMLAAQARHRLECLERGTRGKVKLFLQLMQKYYIHLK